MSKDGAKRSLMTRLWVASILLLALGVPLSVLAQEGSSTMPMGARASLMQSARKQLDGTVLSLATRKGQSPLQAPHFSSSVQVSLPRVTPRRHLAMQKHTRTKAPFSAVMICSHSSLFPIEGSRLNRYGFLTQVDIQSPIIPAAEAKPRTGSTIAQTATPGEMACNFARPIRPERLQER